MYPRATGHCYSHHIPADIVTPIETHLPSDEEMQQALHYLRNINSDLVKGDLVIFDSVAGYRNTGVVIFDGANIIDLAPEPDDYGTLPKVFRVIEGGVPINYWNYDGDTDETHGITHNSIVWFDHSEILQECLDNITSQLSDDGTWVGTSFNYNGEEYHILYEFPYDDISMIDVKAIKVRFHTLLSQTDTLIPFVVFSENDHERRGDNHTLFLQDSDYEYWEVYEAERDLENNYDE